MLTLGPQLVALLVVDDEVPPHQVRAIRVGGDRGRRAGCFWLWPSSNRTRIAPRLTVFSVLACFAWPPWRPAPDAWPRARRPRPSLSPRCSLPWPRVLQLRRLLGFGVARLTLVGGLSGFLLLRLPPLSSPGRRVRAAACRPCACPPRPCDGPRPLFLAASLTSGLTLPRPAFASPPPSRAVGRPARAPWSPAGPRPCCPRVRAARASRWRCGHPPQRDRAGAWRGSRSPPPHRGRGRMAPGPTSATS